MIVALMALDGWMAFAVYTDPVSVKFFQNVAIDFTLKQLKPKQLRSVRRMSAYVVRASKLRTL
eukprot:1068169-Pleurochrysis_carterae.AAC.2